MSRDLKSLYKTVILKHNQSPFNYEKKENITTIIEANNPICGDTFQLYLNVQEEIIQTAHFHGYGCAISKASTSILTQKLIGKTLAEAINLCEDFVALFDENQPNTDTDDEELAAFLAAKDFPGRISCATLSWESCLNDLKTN